MERTLNPMKCEEEFLLPVEVREREKELLQKIETQNKKLLESIKARDFPAVQRLCGEKREYGEEFLLPAVESGSLDIFRAVFKKVPKDQIYSFFISSARLLIAVA